MCRACQTNAHVYTASMDGTGRDAKLLEAAVSAVNGVRAAWRSVERRTAHL